MIIKKLTGGKMKSSDYKCEKCGEVRMIYVNSRDDFPEEVPCFECESKCKRKFTGLYSIVHQGKCGNYKNNYTSSTVSIKKT